MKVTSLIVTYNHAPFIERCIESALSQQTAFPHEILISEDASTDGTREIVAGYAARYPDKIRLFLSDTNLASNQVVARGFAAGKGEYLALLDGDDYWSHDEKLQRQADFLDDHPQCAMCFSNALAVNDVTDEQWAYTGSHIPQFSQLTDILSGNFVATCSTMFRRALIEIPAWYDDFFPITDWPLYILFAEHGSIGFLDEVMGVYRQHVGGLFSSHDQDRKLKDIFAFYQQMNACMDGRIESELLSAMYQFFIEWAEEYRQQGDYARAAACLERAWHGRPLRHWRSARRYWSNWVQINSRILRNRSTA